MKSRWSDAEAAGLNVLELRAYTSRLIGAEPALVLHGGGNTSVKHDGPDHRGRPCRVLAVKGSGWDLSRITADGFAALALDELLPLRERGEMADDAMVEYLTLCLLDSRAPRPSIETLLHAFIPHPWVDHSHADAVLALTNQPEGADRVGAALGDDVAIVPYVQPGFALAKAAATVLDQAPKALGMVLANHGLFTFGATARESYDRHIDIVTRAEAYLAAHGAGPVAGRPVEPDLRRAAELGPILRGLVSTSGPMILRFDGSPRVRAFVDRPDLAAISQVGPITPDHVMRTKRLPLVISSPDRATIADAVEAYAVAYRRYVAAHDPGPGYRHDPYPRVILAPGVGMFTAGVSRGAADEVADLYRHSMDVIEQATALGRYTALSEGELFAMEYWPLELYKLSLAPPKRELAGRVALVTGAGSGIGRAIALRLAAAGAFVFAGDVDADGAARVAAEIEAGAGAAEPLAHDVTSESDTARAFDHIARTAGGADVVISNAGIAPAGALEDLDLETWSASLAVNATGHFLVCRGAVRQMRAQRLPGAIVLVGTKNVFDPGAEFGAYSAAKAAELQLGRVLAIENGEFGIRVNVVNPDAVFADSRLWSDELRRSRAAAHGVAEDALERFYAQRNLLRTQIEPADVAETVLFLASDRSAKTTGAVIPVDGGVRGAFPR